MARLHWFNGAAEAEVARGRPGARPRRESAALLADLEAIPLFYADAGDAVLVATPPSAAWLAELARAGVALPAFVTTPGAAAGFAPAPWGRSPEAARRLGAPWREADRALYAKTTWVPLLAELVAADVSGLTHPGDVGRVVRTEAALDAAIAEARRDGADVVCVKAPWGTSGRGATRVLAGAPSVAQRGWVRRVLASQGEALVEPWRRRVLDLSVQLRVDDGGAEVLAITSFFTDDRGQYIGTRLGAPLADLPPADAARVEAALRQAGALVGRHLHAAGHRGHAGVDALAWRDDAGALRLKPLLEVNPRATMGLVALSLARLLAPGVRADWRLLGRRHLAAAGARDLPALGAALAARHPLGSAAGGGLVRGALFTNDPARAELCLGVVLIGETADAAALDRP